MTGSYQFSPDANREWAQPHQDASNALTETNAAAPPSLQPTQGPISFAADNATSSAGASRDNAFRATAANSRQMGELLHQAAQAYERGDVEAAQRLRAQADQLDGASAAAGGSGGGAGGGQAAGQMMGQFSQLVQGVTQPVQGAMQGLSQIPQQLFQGVQGIVEAATQGAGAGAETAAQTGADAGAQAGTAEKTAGHGDGPAAADGKDDGKDDGGRAPADTATARDEHRADRPHDDGRHQDPKPRETQQLGSRAETTMAPKGDQDRGPTAPTRSM